MTSFIFKLYISRRNFEVKYLRNDIFVILIWKQIFMVTAEKTNI